MKNLICLSALMCVCLLCSCDKEEQIVIETPPNNPSIYWDDFCSVEELHWLPDNLHIIMSDHCNGTLKKINSKSRVVEYIPVEDDHIEMQLYVSSEIRDSFFYTAHAYLENNVIRLFSYNYKTHTTSLIRDNLTLNGSYGLHGYRFVFSGNPIEIIDLKTGRSEFINASGYVRAMSPDQKEMLVHNAPNTMIYDFECDCTKPSPGQINMQSVIQGVVWNNVGLFGYQTTSYDLSTDSRNLQITNFSNGFLQTSIDHYAGGPWSAYQGTQLLVFKYDPDKTKQNGILVAYDCINKSTRNILISESDQLIRGISRNQVSVSPDQAKIAYVELGLSILVAPLN